jgi:hypothetical protein
LFPTPHALARAHVLRAAHLPPTPPPPHPRRRWHAGKAKRQKEREARKRAEAEAAKAREKERQAVEESLVARQEALERQLEKLATRR